MKVLVVDDDPVSLLLAATVVETLGHLVETATSGLRAWELLEQRDYDVLITDREMPGLDGLALCERVRARTRVLPPAGDGGYCYVIILTGHDSPDEAYAGIAAGADDYLTKPLNGHELRLRLLSAQRVTDMHRQLTRQHLELDAVGQAQHALARRDALTLLPNRLALQEHLDRLDANARRYGRGFSLAVLDLDHFKGVNDVAGHAAGDVVLRQVAGALLEQVRETDGLYRYGGEEFVHVIETASAEAASVAADRLRQAVRDLALPHQGRPGECMTASVGVATTEEGTVGTSALLEQADAALYLAKQAGRDRTWSTAAPADRVPGAVTAAAAAVAPAPSAVLDPAPLERMHSLGRQIGRHLPDEIVETWLRQSADRLTALSAAVRAGDALAVRAAAHALKGSSATVGATALAAVCAELEDPCSWADRHELARRAEGLVTPTNDALRALLSSLRVGAPGP